MADTSFIQKLRMANIFPADGGVRQGTPFGMPDLNAGQINPDKYLNRIMSIRNQDENEAQARRIELAQKELVSSGYRQPGLQAVGQSMQQPQQKNTVYQPSMSDYQRAQISLGKDRLSQQGELGNERIDVSRQNSATSSRRADLAAKIADGRATDAEKQEYSLEQIRARGDITSGQIDQRGNIGSRQIGERGDIQKDLTTTRGNQALEQIGARIAGQKDLRDTKPPVAISASQTGNQQENAARQLVASRPDLAQYITIQPNGQFAINPDTPLNELSMIQNAIYPKGTQKDIELPSSDVKSKTPTSTTPKVTSKYKVTVK